MSGSAVNPTEDLTYDEHIQIEAGLEAVINDLSRRFRAGELVFLQFSARDINGNMISGSAER